jgi:hypothetical protein
MSKKLIFVELKSGFSDNGPAWIGYGEYSKSGRTIYFNGQAFGAIGGSGIMGNFMDLETRDEYWISGVKKNGEDRLGTKAGLIALDKKAVEAYLQLIGKSEIDLKKFKIVDIKENIEIKIRTNEIQNSPLSE